MIRVKCELAGTIEGGGYEKRLEENRRVYSPQGISPTVTTRGNSGYEVKIVEDKCKLVGTVEGGGYEKMFEEIRRVYSPDGISPTVTAKTGGNHEVKIATNNKKGYEEVEDGDFLNLQYASSSTRRGRVGKQVAQTICCTDEQGVAVSAPFAYDEQNGYARTDGTVGTLTTDGSSPKHNNRVVVVDDTYKSRDPREYTEYAPSIRAQQKEFKVKSESGRSDDEPNLRIRKLTPLECWRLMDFDDEDFNKAQAVESNTQLYAQAGNSIVVNCLVAIFGQMFDGKEEVYKERNNGIDV